MCWGLGARCRRRLEFLSLNGHLGRTGDLLRPDLPFCVDLRGCGSLICIQAEMSLSPRGADSEEACCEAFLWLEPGVGELQISILHPRKQSVPLSPPPVSLSLPLSPSYSAVCAKMAPAGSRPVKLAPAPPATAQELF